MPILLAGYIGTYSPLLTRRRGCLEELDGQYVCLAVYLLFHDERFRRFDSEVLRRESFRTCHSAPDILYRIP